MSYVHCPTCRRAYNLATQPACPRCTVVAATAPVDVTSPSAPPSLAAAVEQLARALALAPAAERAAAVAGMARLAAAAEPEIGAPPPRAIQRSPRPAPRAASYLPLLARVATAAVRRLAPLAPGRLRTAHARIKALVG